MRTIGYEVEEMLKDITRSPFRFPTGITTHVVELNEDEQVMVIEWFPLSNDLEDDWFYMDSVNPTVFKGLFQERLDSAYQGKHSLVVETVFPITSRLVIVVSIAEELR